MNYYLIKAYVELLSPKNKSNKNIHLYLSQLKSSTNNLSI